MSHEDSTTESIRRKLMMHGSLLQLYGTGDIDIVDLMRYVGITQNQKGLLYRVLDLHFPEYREQRRQSVMREHAFMDRCLEWGVPYEIIARETMELMNAHGRSVERQLMRLQRSGRLSGPRPVSHAKFRQLLTRAHLAGEIQENLRKDRPYKASELAGYHGVSHSLVSKMMASLQKGEPLAPDDYVEVLDRMMRYPELMRLHDAGLSDEEIALRLDMPADIVPLIVRAVLTEEVA